MQPENNNMNIMTQGVPGDMGGKSDSKPAGEKSKMSKKQIVGLVVLSLIAIGGVLFGIYGMNSQNDQIAELKARATDAEGKVAQLETEKITIEEPDGGTTEITDSAPSVQQNPIIIATEPSVYSVQHNIPVYIQGSENNDKMYFYLKNGQFDQCYLSNSTVGDCDVSGLPGSLYKMATIYEGNGLGSEKIGFLASDGSVYYAPIYSEIDGMAVVNKEFVAKKANIDGFVKDIISINYGDMNSHYGHASTVFVMGDNSLVKYDASMFE